MVARTLALVVAVAPPVGDRAFEDGEFEEVQEARGDTSEDEADPLYGFPPWRINRASPWIGLSLTLGVSTVLILDWSVRPRAAVELLHGALELGGTLIGGVNIAQAYLGGGVFANWVPIPHRAGHIVYTHFGVGRVHSIDALGPRHADYLELGLGFRIARLPRTKHAVPFFELGARNLRHCANWSLPCEVDTVQVWLPYLEGGVRFR